MVKPLGGSRVLDLTNWWSGPKATTVSAASGADVIEVTATGRPDWSRALFGEDADIDPSWYERSSVFDGANAGRCGITLDLPHEAGLDVFERCVEKSDGVINDSSARVMADRGLSQEELGAVREDWSDAPPLGLDTGAVLDEWLEVSDA